MMENTIISNSNEKVKYIKNLNEKKFRQKYGVFYIEGIKVVDEVIEKEAVNIKFIAYSKDILLSNNGGKKLLQKIEKNKKIKKVEIETKIFKTITDTVTPQGVIAVMQMKKQNIDELFEKSKNNNILILDKIQDAGNIGTIIRSADAFDINLVLCTNGTTDVYSPKVIRSTMGSIFRVNVVYIDKQDLDIIMYKIKESDYLIATTDLKATNYIDSIDFNKKYAFVLGNEANGVSLDIQNISDINFKIPMQNTAESLNVSVAAGIVLYEQFKNK